MSVNREELGPTVSGNPMIHTCPYRWVRHLVTCISKYQTPGRAPSAREEGEWEEQPRHQGVSAFPQAHATTQIPQPTPWLCKPNLCSSNPHPRLLQ